MLSSKSKETTTKQLLSSSSGDENQLYRLAVVTSHPVQYQAPLLQRLAAQPDIDLTVYYGHAASLTGGVDPDFRVRLVWDRPLLSGYRSHFLSQEATPPQKIWQELKIYSSLILELRRRRYGAVVITEYANPLSWLAYLAAWFSRTPVILRTESELFRPRKWYLKLVKKLLLGPLFRGTAAFLTIGSANRSFYNSFGVSRFKMFDTPYCVDNDYFREQAERLEPQRGELKQQLGFAPDLPIIIFSGKFIERKRPLDLLRAYQQLVAKGCKAGLLMVGEGELRDEMEAFVRKHRLEQVVITGFKNQTELSPLYACGDIFVLPARFDTWGLVVNEAMLFGMPVITTEMVGAGQDLVLPGVTGYSCKVGDVSQLAELIYTLVENPALRSQMGQAARCRVSAWNYDVCVKGVRQALDLISKA